MSHNHTIAREVLALLFGVIFGEHDRGSLSSRHADQPDHHICDGDIIVVGDHADSAAKTRTGVHAAASKLMRIRQQLKWLKGRVVEASASYPCHRAGGRFLMT
jgi:hypothetical protein